MALIVPASLESLAAGLGVLSGCSQKARSYADDYVTLRAPSASTDPVLTTYPGVVQTMCTVTDRVRQLTERHVAALSAAADAVHAALTRYREHDEEYQRRFDQDYGEPTGTSTLDSADGTAPTVVDPTAALVVPTWQDRCRTAGLPTVTGDVGLLRELSRALLGGWDVADWMTQLTCGDWASVGRVSTALGRLADYFDLQGKAITRLTGLVLDGWRGDEGSAAGVFFGRLARSETAVADSLRQLAKAVGEVAVGVAAQGELAADILGHYVDSAGFGDAIRAALEIAQGKVDGDSVNAGGAMQLLERFWSMVERLSDIASVVDEAVRGYQTAVSLWQEQTADVMSRFPVPQPYRAR